MDDLTSGRASIDALRPIAIEDLLGRDEVPPDPQLLGPGILDAVVCVTGAGCSIGTELCRQILALSPARLILLERGEPALYATDPQLLQRWVSAPSHRHAAGRFISSSPKEQSMQWQPVCGQAAAFQW